MDVRIGITQATRELLVELPDDADRDALTSAITAALSGATDTFSLIDRRGREVFVPAPKIAYIEVASDSERRMGFGT